MFGNVCRVATVVKYSGFFSVLSVEVICAVDVMVVVFYICIVMRGTVGARLWEV